MSQRLQSFKEVYDAMKAKWPEKSDEINKLFVAHGIFKSTYPGNGQYDEGEPYWDEDPDGNGPLTATSAWEPGEVYVDIGTPDDNLAHPHQVYTPGEVIGTASNYARATRANKPLERGSFVRADITSNGAAVSDAIFKVSYSFSDPSLNYVSYGVTDQETGYVYVEIPPDEYQMTASITADNYDGGQPITVTANDFYASKASGAGYIKSGTITAGARKSDYCNRDGVCQAGESQTCGDCYLPPPGANSAPQAGGDSSLLVAVVVIALVAVAAFVLLKRRKPAAKAVGQTAIASDFCPMCGTVIPKDSAFCPNCGKKAG
jgi:LPXTG-motif cell wall-anchored protein